jgi:hypothetical protein
MIEDPAAGSSVASVFVTPKQRHPTVKPTQPYRTI